MFVDGDLNASIVLKAVLGIVGIYLVNGIFKTFVFARENAIKEKFPFEATIILVQQNYRILELVQEYFALVLKERNTKSFSLHVLGLPTFVMTNDVANVTHILKTNFENYGKSSHAFKPKFQGLLGNGIFNADGQQWFAHRKTSSHLFKLEQFKTSVLSVFNEDMDQVMDLIRFKTTEKVKGVFDLQDVMQRFTLESISKIAFGTELGCIKNEKVNFAQDFDYCTQCINSSMIDPIWRLSRYCTPAGWKYFFCLYRLNLISYNVIRDRRATLQKEEKSYSKEKQSTSSESSGDEASLPAERVDLLSLYLNKENFSNMAATEVPITSTDSSNNGSSTSLGSKYRDTYLEPSDANLRDVFLNMIIAGRDTTANALSWSFYRLCIHPDVQIKVREEVRAVLLKEGTLESGVDRNGHGVVSYRALQNMKYLDAFTYEVLRLYPSVPKEAKGCLKDEVLPDGTQVYRGDVVCFLPWVMGRDKSLWGEDADEFKPERFLDKPKPNPFVYTAFQAGPRTCLGQNFAILEMKCAIARLLLTFEFTLEQPANSVTYDNSLTLPIKDGLKVSVKELHTK